ncbi:MULTISPECIES: DsbC family protein [Thiomicrorhabdus]|uniref:Thiol:disulfide interchange protein n=1 Tax=Thiomicrorhabdus heinhorstiae TaxID=2748010 RepID=A0ABS0BTR9_9GAMM|nr:MULTISPECIES: DsbC family protein [Thiomicrorhabdus]MBF6057199.1 DsbC family protein [Thiomicrorhabdus heinhorstiae]
MKNLIKALVVGLAVSSPAFAEQAPAAPQAQTATKASAGEYSNIPEAVMQQLKQMLNDTKGLVVKPTPIDGVYEVQAGLTIVYMSADGKYMFNGGLIDLQSRENVTEQTQNELRKLAMAAIPESSMIIYPAKGLKKGEKGRFLTVFTDVDCPYCVKFHHQVPALNKAGVTVRYLSYPRAGIGSSAYLKAVSIWCADDRNKAMDTMMDERKVVPKSCPNPIKDHLNKARYFQVNGTPNIILDDGRLLPGFVPIQKLLPIMGINP